MDLSGERGTRSIVTGQSDNTIVFLFSSRPMVLIFYAYRLCMSLLGAYATYATLGPVETGIS